MVKVTHKGIAYRSLCQQYKLRDNHNWLFSAIYTILSNMTALEVELRRNDHRNQRALNNELAMSPVSVLWVDWDVHGIPQFPCVLMSEQQR